MNIETSNHYVLLETERLTLRRFTETDLENIYQLDNDPNVMRFINGGIHTPRRVIQDDIFPSFMNYDARYPGYGFWAVEEKALMTFLGWISFRPTGSDPLEVTLGFRLRKAAWGKGYATEGARALLNKGFAEMGVQRVIATTYEENIPSRRVLEKIGMKLLQKFRITPEILEKSDTSYFKSTETWNGYDLAYAIDKTDVQAGITINRGQI
jgi:RimJ/RimL family protein N-acetyltransferase